ncbi:MAG: hypothetical protein ACLGHY_07380 [Gammaproteobacteria bacterium]
MTGYESLCVDPYPIDAELQDDGTTGPELAHLARSYRDSPRALVFRNPSSDWRLFVVTLPLATRLSLMSNPIFAQLTRAWGLNVRFIGVDGDGPVHDFRALLSDRTLDLLIELLAGDGRGALDVLFAALAREMLTVLEQRRADWTRHLARVHRLEPGVPGTLFDHAGRYPDFLAKLRAALRDGTIDVAFYGRVLRSIDLREATVDSRVAALIESALDPVTMAKLQRTTAGKHLGCYNWLRIEPRRAAPRAYLLSRLPAFATFFAETLLPLESTALESDPAEPDPFRDPGSMEDLDARDGDRPSRGQEVAQGSRNTRQPRADFDLRPVAARSRSPINQHWAAVLRQAIDAGQDRAALEAIAQRFAVGDNVIRRVWREQPAALDQPPTWHLAQILRRLHALPDREWPANDAAWRALIADSVPAEAL